MPRRATRLSGVIACLALLTTPACSTDRRLAPLPDSTRLVAVGDFGTGTAAEYAVAHAVRGVASEARVEGLLTTGDNIYPDGDPRDYDEAWYQPYGWTADEGVALLAVLGNHDVEGGNAEAVMRLLDMPARWYSTVVGRVQVVALDSTNIGNAAQQRFLERTLDEPLPAGARYRVVTFHHPAHSCSLHQSNDEVLGAWSPLFAEGQVDLVLNGHDHVYERFEPIRGVTYVVTGGGGAQLHGIERCPAGSPELAADDISLHFLVIEATDVEMRIQAISESGDLLDCFTISAGTTVGPNGSCRR
jgi:hypothetical protein